MGVGSKSQNSSNFGKCENYVKFHFQISVCRFFYPHFSAEIHWRSSHSETYCITGTRWSHVTAVLTAGATVWNVDTLADTVRNGAGLSACSSSAIATGHLRLTLQPWPDVRTVANLGSAATAGFLLKCALHLADLHVHTFARLSPLLENILRHLYALILVVQVLVEFGQRRS